MTSEDHPQNKLNTYLAYGAIGLGTYIGYKILSPSTANSEHTYRKCRDDELAEYPRGEKYFVTNPWEKVEIRLAKNGPASWKPLTVFEVYETAIKNNPNAPHFNKEFQDSNGNWSWQTWTRQEIYDQVRQAARAFIALGLKPWETVSIIGFNSPEWIIGDLAAIYAGGLAAGIYTTSNPGQCQYICEHSKTRIVLAENNKQLEKFLQIRDKLPNLSAIIVWNDEIPSDANIKGKAEVMDWKAFLEKGDDIKLDDEVNDRIKKIEPGNCCTLIYTSGTTGPPKAVMISHDNITWNIRTLLHSLKDINWKIEHRIISYLPLSHIAAQFVDIHAPFAICAHYNGGGGVYFARPDALKGSLPDTLRVVKPTIFFGVPRVWEKIEEKMREIGLQSSGLVKHIGDYAKSIGKSASEATQAGGNMKLPYGYYLADKIVFNKIKSKLGLNECQMLVSSAAPIKKSTVDYFHSLGLRLLEVFGMSESTGVHTVSRNYHFKNGSVGSVVEGVENIIHHDPSRDKPNEGEICMRGRHVMMGYMYDAEKTKATIDNQGLLHSGDVGKVDEYDLLHITGRIKELIITAGGENIAPVPIEDYIKDQCNGISNAMLIGDQKKYLTLLITLKCKVQEDSFTNELDGAAKKVNPNVHTIDEAKNDPIWKEYIQKAIDKYNSDPEYCASNAQKIQYFKILDKDFSIADGELTSTLKLKRKVIVEQYKDAIDSMYQDNNNNS